jgi:SOS-response transcriptional repressor LexA
MTSFAVSTVALAVAAVAVAGTACGGSDDDSGTLSKSAFAKQANALCSKAKADRNAQLQQLPPSPSGAADAQKLQSVSSIDRELIRRVDALVPPEAEQDRVDKVLDAWRKRATAEDQYAGAVGAMEDPATLASVTADLAQIDAATDPVAVQLGLAQCTRGTP